MLRIKRIYESPNSSDGKRILVDRLWPRGVSKEDAALDEWMKDVAPSPDLRVWFGHDPAKFKEFSDRYKSELHTNPALDTLVDYVKKHHSVTLLYGAKDPQVNHAIVLLHEVERRVGV